MAKIVIAGAGFAGHFAAITLTQVLKKRNFYKDNLQFFYFRVQAREMVVNIS